MVSLGRTLHSTSLTSSQPRPCAGRGHKMVSLGRTWHSTSLASSHYAGSQQMVSLGRTWHSTSLASSQLGPCAGRGHKMVSLGLWTRSCLQGQRKTWVGLKLQPGLGRCWLPRFCQSKFQILIISDTGLLCHGWGSLHPSHEEFHDDGVCQEDPFGNWQEPPVDRTDHCSVHC